MKNKIFYKSSVERDLKKIDPQHRTKLTTQIREELSKDPDKGKKLKGEFQSMRALRIGDYRVVYILIPDGVLILRIAHRKEVYR
ncbi:MAG: type II toxin-antitoxin system RelE/ParE family toxin [Elusimicrobiota bacterium]|nr:type II toxin-antitoxin system RelE/ParE family toxin [Elusimicrobiota bacterium]